MENPTLDPDLNSVTYGDPRAREAQRLMLIANALILVLLVSLAEGPLRAKVTAINAMALSTLGVLLFIEAFSLPVPAINW